MRQEWGEVIQKYYDFVSEAVFGQWLTRVFLNSLLAAKAPWWRLSAPGRAAEASSPRVQAIRTLGAGCPSITTFTQAGLPDAKARSTAGAISSARVTNSPCPPSAATTRS